MRRILLDTNVVSAVRRTRPDPIVARWLGSLAPARLWLHPVVIAEIRIGIENSRAQGQHDVVAAREQWLARLIATGQIAAFGADDADMWGRMLWSHLPRNSSTLTRDMMIAATAIVGDFAVASINAKDFLLISGQFPIPVLVDPSRPESIAAFEAVDPEMPPDSQR